MLIRVLEIPPSSGDFHFQGGESQTFVEVDWFRDDKGMMANPEGRDFIRHFIIDKNYYDPAKSYLVLHPKNSFTINYEAP